VHALTDRQAAVLGYIRKHLDATGYPPSLREIGDQLGIVSTNGVNDHLIRLERKGYIDRAPMVSRGITVLVPGQDPALTRCAAILDALDPDARAATLDALVDRYRPK
jgi:SOS-response transcriptional repressor LexA